MKIEHIGGILGRHAKHYKIEMRTDDNGKISVFVGETDSLFENIKTRADVIAVLKQTYTSPEWCLKFRNLSDWNK
jgi:ribosomal protein L1